jgi:glycosyltransferase involved in cell wall biosynthesis
MIPDGIRALGEVRACPGPEVIWLGRVLPIKALGLAIASFRHVLRDVPEARLTVVGDGPSLPAVKDKAEDLVDAGRLRFTGRVPWGEGQRLLSQARVHLFTSLRDSFSAQALEAANAGTPTVAMRLGGLQLVQSGKGFHLVNPQPSQNVASRLGAAMSELLRADPAEWMSQSRLAQDFAATCMYTERARLLLDLYTSLAETASRARTRR